MLYALAVEPLLVKIRESIEGWSIPYSNERIKLSANADDIIVLIKDQNNIMGLKNSIDIFGLISSAKVNWSKSEALLCGKWFGGPPKLPGGLSWKSDGIKYLGVYLGNNYMLQRNWEGVLKKVKGKFEKWKWLLPKMSFRGRVIVINNLVTSMLWHRLICVDPPNGLLAKLQAIIVDFSGMDITGLPRAYFFFLGRREDNDLYIWPATVVYTEILNRTRGFGLEESS